MTMQKIPCPKCGQEVYEAETICPYCSNPVAKGGKEQAGSASAQPRSTGPAIGDTGLPQVEEIRPNDFRERVLGLPLWLVFAIVGGLGLLKGLRLMSAFKQLEGTGLEMFASLGPLLILVVAGLMVVRWLLNTLVVWLGITIACAISGEPFEVGFMKGYRTFLPVTMFMLVVSDAGLFLMLLTKVFILAFIAWIANLFILRYFLELEWFEVILLNVVLGLLSMFTGGLL